MAEARVDPAGFPPEFVAALRLLADAIEEIAMAGEPRPIIVGGAAVELWTSARYLSGDFDLLTPSPAPLEDALVARGFRREDRAGHIMRGLYHPTLAIGIECVSGQLFDGRADRDRLVKVDIGDGNHVLVIPPEDVIADRLGQDAAASGNDRSQLRLARMVYSLARVLDEAYLTQRVSQEIGTSLSVVEVQKLLSP